jgi:hypothetical protein
VRLQEPPDLAVGLEQLLLRDPEIAERVAVVERDRAQ